MQRILLQDSGTEGMIIRICAFSPGGWDTADRIKEALKEHIVESRKKEENLGSFAEKAFDMRAPLVFVGACGIAVRTIAPFVKDKLFDSPVIVVDELGKNVIPVLSGHAGGGNELALCIAERIGGNPVITTATDINGLFSPDIFAVMNGFKIINRQALARVSYYLLERKRITLSVSPETGTGNKDIPREISLIPYPPDEKADIVVTSDVQNAEKTDASTLYLIPRELTVGVGCRKNTDKILIQNAIEQSFALLGNKWGWDDIRSVASIDIKTLEYGLVAMTQQKKIPFLTYSAEELNGVNGSFSESEFVREVTGVSNVCERAALISAGQGGELLLKKTVFGPVTIAVAKRKVIIEKWKK